MSVSVNGNFLLKPTLTYRTSIPTVIGLKSRSSLSALQITDKVPASIDGYGDHQNYRGIVVLCDAMTFFKASRKAPTITDQHTGQAQVTAKRLPPDEFTLESGVASLLEKWIENMC